MINYFSSWFHATLLLPNPFTTLYLRSIQASILKEVLLQWIPSLSWKPSSIPRRTVISMVTLAFSFSYGRSSDGTAGGAGSTKWESSTNDNNNYIFPSSTSVFIRRLQQVSHKNWKDEKQLLKLSSMLPWRRLLTDPSYSGGCRYSPELICWGPCTAASSPSNRIMSLRHLLYSISNPVHSWFLGLPGFQLIQCFMFALLMLASFLDAFSNLIWNFDPMPFY